MAVGAGLFTIVAADTEVFVDQQHIGGFADAVVDEEIGDPRIHVNDARKTVFFRLDKSVDILARGHFRLCLAHQFGMRIEHFLERIAVDPDDFGLDRGLDRRGAIAAGDQRHFTDIGTSRQIGEEDRLATDLLLNHHRPDANDINVIALGTFLDNRFASPDIDDLAGLDDLGNIFLGQAGTEHLQQLSFSGNPGYGAFCCGDRCLQLERSGTRDFNHDNILGRIDRRTAPPSRDQTDFTEYRPLFDRDRDRGIISIDFNRDRPLGNREQRASRFILLEYDLTPTIALRLAVEHELAHLQRRQIVQYRNIRPEEFEPFVNRPALRKAGKFRFEYRFVGGLQIGVAVDEFNNVIALVHTVLDQRISRERADDINAFLGALEGWRQFGIGLAVLAGEFDPAILDKFAWRRAAHAGDDPVAFDRLLPVAGFQHQLAIPHLGRGGFVADYHLALLARFHQQLDIGFLRPGKFGRAVQNGDDIILRRIGGQAQRILDTGIARADHRDMLVIIFAGIVELILHQLVVAAGTAHQIGIALGTDRHDDGFGLHHITAFQGDLEIAFFALDLHRLGIISDIHAMGGGLFVPCAQNRFALARIKVHVGTQHQLARRRHDMLAFLIFVDGVGQMVGFFEQNMFQLQLRGTPSGTHARRSGPDYDYSKFIRHALASPLVLSPNNAPSYVMSTRFS